MGKKRGKVKAESAMQVDETPDGGWVAGTSEVPAADMDTSDFVVIDRTIAKKSKLKAKAGNVTKVKVVGKRGNRTKAQKRRKAEKLSKALGHLDVKATKVQKKKSTASQKKELKSLWVNDKPSQPFAALEDLTS